MGVIDLLFPKNCLGCGKAGSYICQKCFTKHKNSQLKCPECTKHSIDGFVHFSCKKAQSIDRIVYFYHYQGVIKKAIKKLKYNFAFDLARDIVDSIELDIKNDIISNKKNIVLVPVPLHKKRYNRRGFNQAEKLSEVLSDKFNWPIEKLVVRIRNTTPQASLEKEARQENLRFAFSLSKNAKEKIDPNVSVPLRHSERVKRTEESKEISRQARDDTKVVDPNKLYLIIDDVSTTGSTMREVCKVLKRNGAGEVWGMSVAG